MKETIKAAKSTARNVMTGRIRLTKTLEKGHTESNQNQTLNPLRKGKISPPRQRRLGGFIKTFSNR
jgi:hypothetical protein